MDLARYRRAGGAVEHGAGRAAALPTWSGAGCLARGWEVAAVFEGNDSSAYGRGLREAYERMLTAVEAGHVDATASRD